MRRLTIALMFIVSLCFVNNAVAWTDHSFHVEQDSRSSKEFYISTFTDELRQKYIANWRRGEVFAISVLAKPNQEPKIVLMQSNVPPEALLEVVPKLRDMIGVLRSRAPELRTIAITYYHPLREAAAHLGIEHRKDKELHEKVAEILNEVRSRRLGI